MINYILTTNSICKNFKKRIVLDNVSINVPDGAIYGLVGNNGAGKTTLLRLITGLQHPSSGEYFTKSHISTAALIETPSYYKDLSVYDNIIQHLLIYNSSYTAEVDDLLEIMELNKYKNTKAGKLSLGNKQRLCLAALLSTNPELVILDEPFNGLDYSGIIALRKIILNQNATKHTTFLITSHNLDEISKICTTLGFIKNGVIIKEIASCDVDNLEEMYRKIYVKEQEVHS